MLSNDACTSNRHLVTFISSFKKHLISKSTIIISPIISPTETFAETEHSATCQFQPKPKLKLKNRNSIKAVYIYMSIYHIHFLHKYHNFLKQ